MKNITIYSSNSTERLIELFLDNYQKYILSDPFRKNKIICKNAYFARIIFLRIAERFGICANIEFVLPRDYFFELFCRVFSDFDNPIDRNDMLWQIYDIFDKLPPREEFKSLKEYFQNDSDDRKRFQLARSLAGIFDDYILFRPEYLSRWQNGENVDIGDLNLQKWQGFIWDKIYEKNGNRIFSKFYEILRNGSLESGKFQINGDEEYLPIFIPNPMPPVFVDILNIISKEVKFDIYLQAQKKDYLRKNESNELELFPSEKAAEEASFADSFDSSFKDFTDILKERLDFAHYHHRYDFKNGSSMLGALQKAAYGQKIHENPSFDDKSITISSCHSKIREIQVLYDFILDTLQKNPDIEPDDIMVLSANLDEYAPFIEAIFSLSDDNSRKIPYTIIDWSHSFENNAIQTFLDILDTSQGRFHVTEVLSILEFDHVRDKFDISEQEYQQIIKWLSEARINWGWKETKVQLELPEYDINTWHYGIKRMLLGYCLREDEKRLYEGILPYEEIEGKSAVTLGKFLDFIDMLHDASKKLNTKITAQVWAKRLNDIIDNAFEPSDVGKMSYIKMMKDAVSEIAKIDDIVDNPGKQRLDFKVIRNYLDNLFDKNIRSGRFNKSGITISSFLSCSGMDKKVIALLGMDESEFPRKSNLPRYNLMKHDQKPGDRDIRKDDKYHFFKAIMSAKEKLYISYIGQSVKDNSEIPPSVLLSEIIDLLSEIMQINRDRIIEKLVTKHPLQPFSKKYFRKDSSLYSYSKKNLKALQTCLTEAVSKKFGDSIIKSNTIDYNITLEQLKKFFINPAQYLIEDVLDFRLRDYEDELSDQEPFILGNLEEYILNMEFAEAFMNEKSIDYEIINAGGKLPHGNPGLFYFRRNEAEISLFIKKVKVAIGNKKPTTIHFDKTIGKWDISGKIENVYGKNHIQYRYAKIKGKEKIRLLIDQLALSILDKNYQSFFYGKDSIVRMKYIDNPLEKMNMLLEIFEKGHSRIIHFFPKSADAFAEQMKKKPDKQDKAEKKARDKWQGNSYSLGEYDTDDYFSRTLDKHEAIDDEFFDISDKIFSIINEYLEEME